MPGASPADEQNNYDSAKQILLGCWATAHILRLVRVLPIPARRIRVLLSLSSVPRSRPASAPSATSASRYEVEAERRR